MPAPKGNTHNQKPPGEAKSKTVKVRARPADVARWQYRADQDEGGNLSELITRTMNARCKR